MFSGTRLRRLSVCVPLGLSALAVGCSDSTPTSPTSPTSDSSATANASATASVEGNAEPALVSHDSAPHESAAAVQSPAQGAQRQALTQEALADLDRAGAFLGAQSRFSFRADLSYDVMQEDGLLLEFGGTREITVRRPDRMRFDAADRGGATKTLTFDGKTISVDLPGHKAYVSIERPGTLYAAIDHLVDDLGVPAPLEDLIGENFAAKVRPRIQSGYFVESEVFGNRRCNHLAYRLPDVDVQVWIEQGERPLLCRISITYLHEPGRPQFRAQLSDWNLEADVADARFAFQPATGARRIPVQKVAQAKGED